MQQIHRKSGSKKGKAPTITARAREVGALRSSWKAALSLGNCVQVERMLFPRSPAGPPHLEKCFASPPLRQELAREIRQPIDRCCRGRKCRARLPVFPVETNGRQIPFRQQTSFQPCLRKAQRTGASDSWRPWARYTRARRRQSSAAQKLPYRQSGLRASRLQSSAAPPEEQGLL